MTVIEIIGAFFCLLLISSAVLLMFIKGFTRAVNRRADRLSLLKAADAIVAESSHHSEEKDASDDSPDSQS